MKSLEEIYIEKSYLYKERGPDGIVREERRSYKNKLIVKTIDAGPRIVHLIVDLFILQILAYLIDMIPVAHQAFFSIIGIVTLLLYPAFYAFMEFQYQHTPGKMLTGSIVINEYAEKPDLRTCLLRSLIRFVPFEGFSCMSSPSRGWHDQWTKTYVISKEELPKLKELLQKHNSTL